MNITVTQAARICGGQLVGVAVRSDGLVYVGATDLKKLPSPARLAGLKEVPVAAEGGETADACLARRAKFPAGTYGSFFKNPPGAFAGRLLEEAGAKGLRVGGAYVWSGHANVIVRGEGATGSDVLALARLMRNRVFFRFGISLEPEVSGVLGRSTPLSRS